MKLQIILGSTRPGRIGERIAQWILKTVEQHPDFEAEIVDLADYNLPHFNEAVSPRFNPTRQMSPAVKHWTDKIAEADGYIIVTPEYNHSIPGVLKDALDYLDWQIDRKAVGFVSYGSVGGARAVEHARQIVNFSGAAVVPYSVTLANPTSLIDETGKFIGGESQYFGRPAALQTLLDELGWWTEALNDARTKRPRTAK